MQSTETSSSVLDLIAQQGESISNKPYILFDEEQVTFGEYATNTRRIVNGLYAQGAQPGDGVVLLMGNCPEYLAIHNGLPLGGLYSVPTNTSLKGDGLRFILTHSDSKFLIVDDVLYPRIQQLGASVGDIRKVFVRRTTEDALPEGTIDMAELFSASVKSPDRAFNRDAITSISYTSGTTGFPKGVVARAGSLDADKLKLLSSLYVKPDDIMYTALPMFHSNALILTASFALCMGIPFGLDKTFSASRFWDRTRHYGATTFNALGAMIPILMKQPERPDDRDNPIRLVCSSACPANLWRAFEERYDVTIWETYGAVDGGGVLIFNLGSAPVGSVGMPMPGVEWKLVDDDGTEVAANEPGEFISKVQENSKNPVEYYKNEEATSDKVRGGWIYSSDLFHKDDDGNLYFLDRKTDSMRRRGENISSWEVESVVDRHASVSKSAAFGVPSELGEDEVMVWVQPAEGASIDLKDLMRHCADNLAYFMVPRYVDIVDDIPSTGTLRVQKGAMKKRGVSDRTWDREKEMPELDLKR